MRTAACLLALTATLTATLAGPGQAASATSAGEDTCFGLAPTIVGTDPGASTTLTGTEGPDVIVTNGVGQVDALGGDDKVCASGQTWRVDLGAGSDSMLGGGEGYTVDAGDADDVAAGQPWGTDTIMLGKGSDYVHSGAPGGAEVNRDEIRMGIDRDTLQAYWPLPTVDAGADHGDLLYLGYGLGRVDWVIDNVAGAVTANGISAPDVTGFDGFDLRRLSWTSLDFIGGPRGESVFVYDTDPDDGDRGHPKRDGAFSARMGAGRDELAVRGTDPGPFDGGAGRDELVLLNDIRGHGQTRFLLDLAREEFGYPRRAVSARRFEDATLLASLPMLVGDERDNRLLVHGCDSRVYGGPGEDLIHTDWDMQCRPKPLGITAYGGPGDDVLVGSVLVDRLLGGPGRDRANGLIGHRDVCVAEIETGCER